jgi:hypothetical protein
VKHDYEAIVHEALTEPGKLSAAYSAFWNYSLGNQWLAMIQLGRCEPINTFPGWKALGRYVKKNEKAIELLMPVTVKDKADEEHKKTIFLPKKHWFGLHQTDGDAYIPVIPEFDITKAESELQITVEPFHHPDGNCQGYAITDKRIIAINPVAYDPVKTGFHECAHVILHPNTTSSDSAMLAPDVKEVEAELTAYLVCSCLRKAENLQYSRGYIKNWMRDGTVEKVRFGAVFAATDKILKAGRVEPDRPHSAPEKTEQRPTT